MARVKDTKGITKRKKLTREIAREQRREDNRVYKNSEAKQIKSLTKYSRKSNEVMSRSLGGYWKNENKIVGYSTLLILLVVVIFAPLFFMFKTAQVAVLSIGALIIIGGVTAIVYLIGNEQDDMTYLQHYLTFRKGKSVYYAGVQISLDKKELNKIMINQIEVDKHNKYIVEQVYGKEYFN